MTPESPIGGFYTLELVRKKSESPIGGLYTPERARKKAGKSYRRALYPRTSQKKAKKSYRDTLYSPSKDQHNLNRNCLLKRHEKHNRKLFVFSSFH